MRILGIETSCDETAASVVDSGREIRSSVTASQIDLHSPFGGVIPEIAARSHQEVILAVVDRAVTQSGTWDQIDGIAVTARPGLITALLVGLTTAKTLSLTRGKPFWPVDHLLGHLYAPVLADPTLQYPFVALLVSGGHSALYRVESPLKVTELGGTRDDAAGEAFDKVSSILGLGYPGGPAVSKAAEAGNPKRFAFARALKGQWPPEFSFSGLKTAVLHEVRSAAGQPANVTGPSASRRPDPALLDPTLKADLAASFEACVVDVLASASMDAAQREGIPRIVATGGVAANKRLRSELAARSTAAGMTFVVPPFWACTDNAAFIAGLGYHVAQSEPAAALDLDATPTAPRPSFRGR